MGFVGFPEIMVIPGDASDALFVDTVKVRETGDSLAAFGSLDVEMSGLQLSSDQAVKRQSRVEEPTPGGLEASMKGLVQQHAYQENVG